MESSGSPYRCFNLAHVGGDDGKYHSFDSNYTATSPFTAATGTLINSTNGSLNGLVIHSVTEENKLSETEQNETFSDFSDDFLDFSEDNPFGDPEDQ